jgi:hypothetical protein
VYSYEVEAVHRAAVESTSVFCSSHLYVAALPGSTRRITESLREGLRDPIPRVYVYGMVPKAAQISVVRFDGAPGCGTRIDALPVSRLRTERDATGYYAVVLGIRVTMPGHREPRTFPLVTGYPTSVIQERPISARFDLSPTMIDAALNEPADTLLCSSGES